MTPVQFKRWMISLILSGAFLAAAAALSLPGTTYAQVKCLGCGKPTPAPTDAPPPPTPENGARNCAVSHIVGYTQPGGEQQFYYAGSDGSSYKIGGVAGGELRGFLTLPIGANFNIKGSQGTLTLTNRGAGVFTTHYLDSDGICSRPDLR